MSLHDRSLRRWVRLVVVTCCGVMLASTVLSATGNASLVLRVGYQQYGTLILLKARGTLEQRLQPRGIAVQWTEFPAGPELLEGLHGGRIDVGATGEAPPVFAQAAGAQVVYVGHAPPAPAGEAIVVPKQSSLQSVTDLKGKKVALHKGSNAHYLLVKALEQVGLRYQDIEPVFLPPAEARTAFERGSVAAWAIWDPFLAAAEQQLGARILADGQGLVSNHQFYLAAQRYVDTDPDVVTIVFEELDKIGQWGTQNPQAVVDLLAPQVGLDKAIVARAVARLSYGIRPLGDQVVAAQQQIADVFTALQLIPQSIRIRDAVWQGQH
jgi:sulfonate transport system substrate-binding protein